MQNYLILMLFFLCYLNTNAQVGIETQSPQTALDVNGDLTLRKELRLKGTSSTAGNPGQDGQVLFSQDGSNEPMWKFVNVPFLEEGQIQLKYSYAVVDEVGIQFSTGAGDLDDVSSLGETLSNAWTEIPGMETEIDVNRPVNRVALMFQSGVEMPNTYNSENTSKYFVRYTCGVFMNDELVALRGDQINGINNKNTKNQGIYTLSYILSDVEVGTHTLKVACRKIRTNSGGDYALAIGAPLNTGTNVANNFMLSSNFKIDVMEYIIND